MTSKKKASAIPLRVFIHAKRMSWDSDCVFVTGTFAKCKNYDAYYSDSLPTRLGSIRVKDLAFLLIVEKGKEPQRAPMDSLEYRDVHNVTLYEAKEMARSLEAFDRAMRKLSERFGYVESLRSWLRRMCDVLWVTEIVFSREVADFAGMKNHYRDENGCAVLCADTADYWLQTVVDAYAYGPKKEPEASEVAS